MNLRARLTRLPSAFSGPHRRLLATLVVLVTAATCFRAWALVRTWFYLDDFPLLVAARKPLTAAGLMDPYIGHLMPSGRLLTWVSTQLFPLAYLPIAGLVVVMFALAGAGTARLLWVLFGPRWGIVPPLVLFLMSPLLAGSTLWWAAAVNQLPALAAIAWGSAAHVRYLQTGERRHLVATVAIVLLGLSFSELTLLVYVFLAFLTLMYFSAGGFEERIRHVFRRYRPAVVAHTVVVVGYALLYWPIYASLRVKSQPRPLQEYFLEMGAKAFTTAAVGGPLSWQKVWSAQFETHPSSAFVLLSWFVLIGLLLASDAARTGGLRAVLLVVLVLTVKILLMYTGRAVFGPTLGLDVRYLYELALAFALFVGLAFLPVQGALSPLTVKRVHWLADDRRLVTGLLGLFVVLAAVSNARHPLRHLGPDDPKPYFETVRQEAAKHSGRIQMADAGIPPFIFSPMEGRYRSILPLVSSKFVSPEVALDRVYTTDKQGHLQPLTLTVVRRADGARARQRGCAYRASGGRVEVPLDGPVMGFGWVVRLRYSAATETRAQIAIGDERRQLSLPAGEHTVWLPGNAAYDAVSVRDLPPDARFCVRSLSVGSIKLDY